MFLFVCEFKIRIISIKVHKGYVHVHLNNPALKFVPCPGTIFRVKPDNSPRAWDNN